MSDPKGYTPEGVKYTFPDDDPYQESNEIYYNMVDFLDDSEVHQIWEIVGKALDRNNIVTTDNESLSVRVYDEISYEDNSWTEITWQTCYSTSMTLKPRSLFFCLEPILTTGIDKNELSLIPEDEFPTKHSLLNISLI